MPSSNSNNSPKQARARSTLYVLCGLGFISLVVLMLFAGEKSVNASNNQDALVMQNAQVDYIEVQLQEAYTKQQKVYGLLESPQQANIGFELAGVIAALEVQEGTMVHKGQALASVNTQRLRAQREQIAAAITRAKADANLAALSAKRVSELVKAKLEPPQRLDEVNAQLEAANALLNEVIARELTLEVELEKSTLVAPFDGQIVSQLLDEGTVVNAGQPVFTLVAKQTLEARFGLPTNTAFTLKVGEEHQLSIGDAHFTATLQSIANIRNRATRTLDAVFTIEADALQNFALVPGDLVSLSVDARIHTAGSWLPLEALSDGVRGLWTVFVLEPNDAQFQVARRMVSVEYLEAQRAFVRGALDNGDKVVIKGAQRLTPNQQVNNAQLAGPRVIAQEKAGE